MPKKIKITIFALLFGFSAIPAFAANVFFNASPLALTDRDFKVDVAVDATGENLNAFEGTVIFPDNLLKVKEIRDGDSVVNFWIEKPKESGNGIRFSGIVPGGFRGIMGPYAGEKPGKLFSIIFSPVTVGNGIITAENARILLEDGAGTPAEISVTPFQFSVEESGIALNPAQLRDLNPPEAFRLEIANDSAIFDNRNFLVFAATDKESGIKHYEILETKNDIRNAKNEIEIQTTNDWIIAESPYLLKNQGLSGFIFVKAVDKAGNERMEILEPLHLQKVWYENGTFWIIIMGVLAVLGIVILWKEKSKK